MTIKNYLEMVYKDFEEFVRAENDLCELRKLHYQGGQIPDYTDIHMQQLYLLRYTFSYAFEYKSMFKTLFSNYQFGNDIKVMSLGCGNGIDYWSLCETLDEIDERNCRIRYRGVDVIEWNYQIIPRTTDDYRIVRENIADELTRCTVLTDDVYFFPKSISEFSNDELDKICNSFKTKVIEKDKIHVMISLRAESGSMERDMQRSEKIVDALRENGYDTKDGARTYTYFVEEEKGIKALDHKFEYPDEALELLKTLNLACNGFEKNGIECQQNCEKYLNRWPALRARNVRYQILTFRRKEQE